MSRFAISVQRTNVRSQHLIGLAALRLDTHGDGGSLSSCAASCILKDVQQGTFVRTIEVTNEQTLLSFSQATRMNSERQFDPPPFPFFFLTDRAGRATAWQQRQQ